MVPLSKINHFTKNTNKNEAEAEGQEVCKASGHSKLRHMICGYRAHGQVQTWTHKLLLNMMSGAMGHVQSAMGTWKEGIIWPREDRKHLTRRWLQTHTKGIIGAWQVEKCRKVILGRENCNQRPEAQLSLVSSGTGSSTRWLSQQE